MKIVWRCHTEKRVFGSTINSNSKLGGFISVLMNPPLNVDFLTRLSCVIVYLLNRAQMCAVFWGVVFWGAPPRIHAFTASGS